MAGGGIWGGLLLCMYVATTSFKYIHKKVQIRFVLQYVLLIIFAYSYTKLYASVFFVISCTESIATLPPFSPIEGQKWFDRISSQWESRKNRFALIYFGKIRFLPPCIWNIPFMSYSLCIWQQCGAKTKYVFIIYTV